MNNCVNCGTPNINYPQVNPAVTPTNTASIKTPVNPNNSAACVTPVNSQFPQRVISDCTDFELTNNPETALIQNFIDQSLNIGASNVNVYKLLGIYEQGLLQDLTGNGQAISGGFIPSFPPSNAFEKYVTQWASSQTGTQVICTAYIGYDFGPILLNNGRLEYGIPTAIMKDICTINIKQGCNSENRCSQVRVERSNDSQTWYGVTLLDLPNNDSLATFNFKRTVPSRYWRLRPTAFNGGSQDYWIIQAIQLIDYEMTDISNIQDRLLLENRDRNYSSESITMKGSYRPIDVQSRSSKFGFLQDADQYIIEVSFNQTLNNLARPFVIGDIVQLPAETQYTPTLQPILKYLEIIDVAWSTNGYTPQWVPTMQRLIAVPALQSQETQDIFGQLNANIDSSGLMNVYDGNAEKYQDISNISQTIEALSQAKLPERGENDTNVAKFSEELVTQLEQKNINAKGLDRRRTLYGIDGMPPNGAPYTEGDTFPNNPVNGDYHRLTYSNIGTNIPPRLHRYSEIKGFWIYLETDLRYKFKSTKPYLQEFIDTNISTPVNPNGKLTNER